MTNTISKLTSPEPPWLFRSDIGQAPLAQLLEELETTYKFATCLLDVSRMKKELSDVYGEFARGLEFPDYFGYNSNAFDECITDLDWLNASGFCIAIKMANQLLPDQPDILEWLIETLDEAAEEWSIPVNQGEQWDRPSLPFHVIFQTTTTSTGKRDIVSEIAALPML